MRFCTPCQRTFRSWRAFSRHMAEEHQVNPGNLARRAAQVPDGDLYACQSDSGRWFLVAQPPLL